MYMVNPFMHQEPPQKIRHQLQRRLTRTLCSTGDNSQRFELERISARFIWLGPVMGRTNYSQLRPHGELLI